MAPGSALLQEINNRPANDPIFYTNVATRDDEWIVPDTNALMANNCNRKTAIGENLDCNILIQRFCPDYRVSHAELPSDAKVFSLIKRALVHVPVDLGCGPVVDAPPDIECGEAPERG